MHLQKIFSHRNRALLRELVATEFKLRYQGSAIGYLWSLVRPLFLFAILLTVFGFVLKIRGNTPHYSLALLLGIVLWNFFIEATNTGLQSIVSRGDLIRKINFPKYIIVISGTVSALINLGFSLIIVLVFLLVAHVQLGLIALLFPLLLIEMYALALALAFFLSALYVRYRDVSYIWELVAQAGFYATPIIYPFSLVMDKSHTIAQLLLLNPMGQIVQDARYVLITDQTETLIKLSHSYIIMAVPIGVVLLTALAGGLYFRHNARSFAETI